MRCYVINLDRRADRWAVTRDYLYDKGFDVTRFSAIDDRWRGCRDSHLAILEQNKHLPITVIFEDDILFTYEDDIIRRIFDSMAEMPVDWDCLYLGASPKEPQERYSEHLYKLNNAHVTHAILWHNREGGAVDYILEHRNDIDKIDDFFAKTVQPMFNCYVCYPLLSTQRQTQSDTCKRSDVSTIEKNYKLYCK